MYAMEQTIESNSVESLPFLDQEYVDGYVDGMKSVSSEVADLKKERDLLLDLVEVWNVMTDLEEKIHKKLSMIQRECDPYFREALKAVNKQKYDDLNSRLSEIDRARIILLTNKFKYERPAIKGGRIVMMSNMPEIYTNPIIKIIKLLESYDTPTGIKTIFTEAEMLEPLKCFIRHKMGAEDNPQYDFSPADCLKWAVDFRLPEIVQLLITSGFDPNKKSKFGITAFQAAQSHLENQDTELERVFKKKDRIVTFDEQKIKQYQCIMTYLNTLNINRESST